MISFNVRMRFRSEDRQEIAEVLRELTLQTREEPGCVTYVPHAVETDPDVIVIYEQYTDQSAAEFHRTTAHFAKYAVGGLYQRMLERSVEMLTTLA